MLKKAFVSITILILILALASVNAMALNGTEKKKPTESPAPTDPPPTDPPPTEVPDTGDLYGDLYVILRDENGVPILDYVELEVPPVEEGQEGTVVVSCIQPISTVDGSVTLATYYGDLTITAIAGEPFALPSYFDIAGDLVECELPEEMATWVQAVDFGRLNLGRAPDAVIAHGFDEAVTKLNLATAINLDPAGRLVLTLPDAENPGEYIDKTIDAPAENLALYIKMMLDGHWITTDTDPVEHGGGGPPEGKGPPEGDGPSSEPRPVLNCDDGNGGNRLAGIGLGGLCYPDRTNADLNNRELLQAASLLAAAADKTGTFTLDKVVYINSVFGINQAGSLPGEVADKTYFDFRNRYVNPAGENQPYLQDRGRTYGIRSSGDCRQGRVWVLQPTGGVTYSAMCIEILAYENSGHNPRVAGVHFTDMEEAYTTVFEEDENGDPIPLVYDFIDNVRGFAQSADDALRVIEYIHNYKVPEVLYE